MQIINITDPARPAPVSAVFDYFEGFSALRWAADVEVYGTGNSTYAVVASMGDDGVQIINITDPARPAPASAILDGSGGFTALKKAANVEVYEAGNSTYAVVAARYGNWVQIVDITDPARPAPMSAVFDDSVGPHILHWAADVEVYEAGNSTYAVVAVVNNGGVKIINITDPANPAPVSAVFDHSEGFGALKGATDVEVYGAGDRAYAVVAAIGDDGVQIMDITDPMQPAPVSAVFDHSEGFDALKGAADVYVYEMRGRAYAFVAAMHDHGLQIMDITNPMRPVSVSAAFDGYGEFSALEGAADVEVYDIGDHTYGIVAAIPDGGVQIMDITPPLPRPLDASIQITGYERLSRDNNDFVQISIGITNRGSTILFNDNQNGTVQPGELHVSLNAIGKPYPNMYAALSCDATRGHCVWSNGEYIAYNDMTREQAQKYGIMVSGDDCTAWDGWNVQPGETAEVKFCYWVDAEFEPESMQFYRPDAYLVQSIPFLESGSCYLPYMLCDESALMFLP